MNETTTTTIQIEQLAGDNTVLCAILASSGRIVAVVNTRYLEAEAHARAHIAAGVGDVLICGPDCDVTQR